MIYTVCPLRYLWYVLCVIVSVYLLSDITVLLIDFFILPPLFHCYFVQYLF